MTPFFLKKYHIATPFIAQSMLMKIVQMFQDTKKVQNTNVPHFYANFKEKRLLVGVFHLGYTSKATNIPHTIVYNE